MSDAFAAVKWLLDQEEPEARRVAVQQIVKVRGREGADLLLRALSDDDWRVRKEAAYVATALEPREVAIAALVSALDERMNIGLRNAAVEALVAIGSDAVPAAIDALSRMDQDGRKLAVEILGGVPDVRGTRALTRAILDDDPNVRAAAAEALGNAGLAGEEARDLAIGALCDALSASEMFLKLAALDALARLDAKLPWKVFEPYAADPVLRRYAILAAAGSRETAAILALTAATADTSPTIAREATIALADSVTAGIYEGEQQEIARGSLRASPRGRSRVRRLAAAVDDARARGAALLILGLLRDEADVTTLIEGLADENVAERAELAIVLFGETAAAAVLAASESASPQLRAALVSLLPEVAGSRAAELGERLRGALRDAAPEVLAAAAKGLGAVGDGDDLERIIPLMLHAEPRVASAAQGAMYALATRHPAAARAALREGQSLEATVRCFLLGAIGRGSQLREEDVAFLERALAYESEGTRRAAVDALASIGGRAAADLIAFALADEAREVQLAATRALGRLGRAEPLLGVIGAARDPALVAAALRAVSEADTEQAFAAARPLVKNADPAIACAAVEAIGRLRASGHISGAKAADGLFEALEHMDAEVVKVALSEIASDPDARALTRLGLCLDHVSWEVRRLAAELLGQEGSPSAIALLRARYEREHDPAVRDALAAAVSVRPASFAHATEPTQSGMTAKPLNPTPTRKPGQM